MCLATVYREIEGQQKEVLHDVAWVKVQKHGLECITLLGQSKIYHAKLKSIDLVHGLIVLEGMEKEHAHL